MDDQATPISVPARIMGYTDRVSYRPGDAVAMYVSTPARSWRGELLRLHSLEIPSAGIARRAERVTTVQPVEAVGLEQETAVGSYVRVDGMPASGPAGLTISVRVLPTRPGDAALGSQVVLAHAQDAAGWSLGMDAKGRATLTVGTAAGPVSVSAGPPLSAGLWYEFEARIPGDTGLKLALAVRSVGTFASDASTAPAVEASASVRLGAPVMSTRAPLLWGCRQLRDGRVPELSFDGRVENPVIVGDASATGYARDLAAHPAVLAAWDLARDITPDGIADTRRVTDAGPHARHGVAHQHPHRLVTSSGWTGDVFDARFAADQYAAIHFHRDDITDCGWRSQVAIELPDDLPSGVYGVQLVDSDGTEDLLPVFVGPRDGLATAPLLLVLPTNSYLAYANDHVGVDSPRTQVVMSQDIGDRSASIHR